MLWYDTSNNILKMRTEADDAWISISYLDQTTDAFRILDDTQVVNTSGTQTGLLGDQATATWETGTATTESLVSPAKIKAAIEALGPATDVGAATAALSAGGVGTYCFAEGPTSNVAFGSTASGSDLQPTSAYWQTGGTGSGSLPVGTALSGTWRAMGTYTYRVNYGTGPDPSYTYGATLWLRIS
jgi:hypothetical protein